MRFADPLLLVLILVVPLLLLLRRGARPEARPGLFSSIGLLSGYRQTRRVRFRWIPTALRAIALVLFVIALARPQSGQAQSELPGQGIDIALVQDISSSMTTTSFGKDTRIAVAERVMTNFIKSRKDDRLGLVVFRDQSLVLSPLTLDYNALLGLVPQLDSINLPDGTAIGLGLADGVNILRDSKARSRVVILLTDGENNNDQLPPLTAARIAQTLGIRVYTIGIIDPRLRGGSGADTVDEAALRQMANITGGRYFPAENEQALAAIYQNIDSLEKSRVGRPQFAAYDELAIYFLAAGLALLAGEVLLRSTLWRQTA